MKLDYLFQRRSDTVRQEPSLERPGRSLIALDRPSRREEAPSSPDPQDDDNNSNGTGTYWDPPAPRQFSVHYDPTAMSPRQLSDWAHDMYLCRKLKWEEYRVVGFPAELHPDYNRTVGVLTGRRATPDEPRDMVAEWEERLAFARRHNDADSIEVRRTTKVLALLKADAGLDAR